MKIKKRKYALRGFTIAELLVVLALTSISISLSYGTLTYIQKLFGEYKKQNKFLNEFTDLKNRLNYESLRSDMVIEGLENSFEIKRDSAIASLQILEHVILLKRNENCDTFHISARNIRKHYEQMNNPVWTNRLVSGLEFETEFTKQKFTVGFYKEHAASLKLELETQE